MGAFLRRYATLTAGATNIGLPMIKYGLNDFAAAADWTPAAGDVKVSIDGGAQANIANLPAYSNGQWAFTLTAAELTGKRIVVVVVDAATKAVEDQFFVVETFGHASAMYARDLAAAGVVLDSGTVSAGTSATQFVATGGSLNTTSGAYDRQFLLFVTGALAGERRTVLSHTVSGSDHTFRFQTGFSGAPGVGDTFIVG